MQKQNHRLIDRIALWLLVRLWHKVEKIEKGIIKIMALQDDILLIVTEVDEKLDKALAEILARIAELEELINQGNVMTPELQAKLDELRADAQALDDVVPDLPPTPEPEPEP